ncbi:MAG: hypothetical protein ABSE17_04035 [Candidatus Levyibacteriota bacterium]
MKEQGPNQGADRLTNQANSPKLEREGDVFMAEGNGNGGPEQHGAPIPPEPQQPTQPATPGGRNWDQERERLIQGGASADVLGLFDQLKAESTGQGLRAHSNRGAREGVEIGSSARLYLEQADLEMLSKDPISWLDSKFDMIYEIVQQGRELDSPLLNQMQTMITVAANHISTYASHYGFTTEQVQQFTEVFNTRLSLIFARSLIEHKNTDNIKPAMERLQSHGLLTALTMEDGKVNVMFNRLGELLEDQRLAQTLLMDKWKNETDKAEKEKLMDQAQKLHVTPEMMHNLQDALIDEQTRIFESGAGPYVEEFNKLVADATSLQKPESERMSEEAAKYAKGEIVKQIRRAVRTAYDVFVVSQRQAIIVSRGHSLEGLEAYRSDPAVFFNMFNLEDLLTKKFGMFNKSANDFLDHLKLEIARSKLSDASKGMSEEELLDYGTRMFRVFFGAPDFFSSDWRIEQFQDKIQDYLAHARADASKYPERYVEGGGKLREISGDKDFALFLRLKKVGRFQRGEKGDTTEQIRKKQENNTKLKDAWGKIAEIRPEEMLRLFRERAVESPALRGKLKEFLKGPAFNKYRAVGATDEFEVYDKFKAEFGAITQLIRQKNYENFHALRIGEEGFTPDEKAEINKYVGNNQAAEQLRSMYAELSRVAGQDDTINTLLGDKFEDIYTRELLVDDVLLNVIDKPVNGVTPLSSTWQSEPSQDPLVRNFGDLLNMATAASELVKFIGTENTEERLKNAMGFAEAVSAYNGQRARAECVRYTVGTFLEISEQDFFWDALGIGKLPFRLAMSEIEKVYGPQAKPMSRDQVRHQLDEIRSTLQAAVEKAETPEAKVLANENAEKYYHELEKLLKVRGSDMVKLRGLSLTFFLILAALAEGYFIIDIKGLTGKK